MKKILRIVTSRLAEKQKDYFEKNLNTKVLSMKVMSYQDLFYDGKFKYLENEQELEDFDILWTSQMNHFRLGLNYYFNHLDKKEVIDPRNKYRTDISKFSQLLCLNYYNFSTPKSRVVMIIEKWISRYIELLEKKFKYPFIAKEVDVDGGEGVFLMKDKNTLKKFFEENLEKTIIFQEYIENTGDLRLIVMRNKFYGAIQRYNGSTFKNNVKQGGKVTKANPSKELQEIAVDIAKKYNLDIAGVDIIIHNNQYYVLEINTGPEFKGFEKGTGLKYTDCLLDFFQNKRGK